jgi:transposase
MPKVVPIKDGYTPTELRHLAAASKDANQSRRLLSIAAALDGMSRADAAKIGGMDRQTLRDWVHRFNERGPEGLKDGWCRDKPRRLSDAQQAEFAEIVETGPDRLVHGVVRWRRIDLQRVIAERFGVAYHERTIGKLLKHLGFSHVSGRPRHPKQDGETIAAFKKLPPRPRGASRRHSGPQTRRDLVPRRGAHRPEERPRPPVGAARNPARAARRSAL